MIIVRKFIIIVRVFRGEKGIIWEVGLGENFIFKNF